MFDDTGFTWRDKILANLESIVVGQGKGTNIVLSRERTNYDDPSYVWYICEQDSGTRKLLWEQDEPDLEEVKQELDRRNLFNPFK